MNDIDALAPGTHEILIDGVPQIYHVAGTGPVCLILPDGPGLAWEYLRMPLVEENLTAVYVESVGTGKSGRLKEHPSGYTPERFASHVEQIMDHLGVRSSYLMGHSHGGVVAQHFALTRPHRLTGLILYSTTPHYGHELLAEANEGVRKFAIRFAHRPEADDVVRAWESSPSLADDEMTDKLRRMFPIYFADYWAHAEKMEAVRSTIQVWYIAPDWVPFDARDELSSVTVPTLVVTGRHDVICGERWAHELHRGIPGSHLVELGDSGHFAHLEEPEPFAASVAQFVSGRAAAGM